MKTINKAAITSKMMKQIVNQMIELTGLPLIVRKIDAEEKFAAVQVIVQHGAERKHLRNLEAACELAELIEESTGWQVFMTEHNSAL